MPLFRCLNEACADGGEDAVPVLDFENADGKCPKCGATNKDNPRTVVKRETVHYLVNDDTGPIRGPNGRRLVACDPARGKLPKHATAVTGAVSCPACQASAVFAAHVAGNVDQTQRVTPGVPPQLAGGTVGGESN